MILKKILENLCVDHSAPNPPFIKGGTGITSINSLPFVKRGNRHHFDSSGYLKPLACRIKS